MIKQKEFSYGDRGSIGNNINVKEKGANYLRNILIANRIIVVLIIAFSIGYMLSVNDLSIKGFVLNDLKSQLKDLEKENSLIESQFAQLESNNTINTRAQQWRW